MQCFLQAGDGFCELVHTQDDLSDLTIKLDRSKILTVGHAGMLMPSPSDAPITTHHTRTHPY